MTFTFLKNLLIRNRLNSFFLKYRLPSTTLADNLIHFEKFYPLIFDEICLPPYRGEKNLNDYSILFSIINQQKPRLILELGTAHGNTVANICSQFGSQVVTINALPEQMEGRVITYSLSKDDIGYLYRRHGFTDLVTQIYENTRKLDLSKFLCDREVDLAIIDACHDSDFVVNDFLKIKPFMASNSIILFHDTHPSITKHFIDSYIGCMYLRKLGFNIKYIENSSWGVWFAEDDGIEKGFIEDVFISCKDILERLIWGRIETDIKRIRSYARGFLRETYLA